MKKIWEFLNSKVFLYILLGIFFFFILNYCNSYRDERRQNLINQQNISALNDTIRTERTKNGELQASISGYIATVDELKDLNENLYREVRQQRGEVLSLNRVIIGLEQDKETLRKRLNELESIMNEPIFINDSVFSVSWVLRYDWDANNFDIFKGNTYLSASVKPGVSQLNIDELTVEEILLINHLNTEMVNRETQIELVFGQRVEDNKLRVFVQSNYPGFTARSLEGVLIDPSSSPYMRQLMRTRQWFPNTWTVGFGPSLGYDFSNSKPYLGVGINVNYNIFQW